MRVTINKCTLSGTINAPASKSFGHRLMICAALSGGVSHVSGISDSEDMLATLDCISALGAKYEKNGGAVTIYGVPRPKNIMSTFPCRESGSTLRFFIPISISGGGDVRFTGTKRLIDRGIGIYEELFVKKSISVKKGGDSISISGTLPPGEYTLRGDVSSQFISGLLFALPLLDGDSVIKILPPVESRAYIDITVQALKTFGVTADETERNVFRIKRNQTYKSADVSVEGDWSNAAALYGLKNLGHDLNITGLNESSIQGDMICRELLEKLDGGSAEIDLSNCPDLGPVLFAAAAAKGGAHFTGTRRLRIKESDRASAMAEELEKFGILCEVGENSVTVFKGKLHAPRIALSAHNDHRIVMAMTMLLTLTGGEIDGAQAINKSYPNFFDELEGLGLEVTYGP